MILATITHSGRGNYEGQLGDPLADAHRIVDCVNACEGLNPESVPYLLERAKALLDNWENGNLSGYVQSLAAAIAEAEGS